MTSTDLDLTTTAVPRPATRTPGRAGSARIRFGLAVIIVYVVAAAIGPWLVRFDPVATRTQDRLKPPGSRLSDGSLAILGTDQVGQDLLAQMLQGARISIAVGLA